MKINSQTLSSAVKKQQFPGGFWHATEHYHCLLLSFPKSLTLKLRNLTDGLAPGVKRKWGGKIQASVLPCVSVTSAGSSAGQSTPLAALVQAAVPGCRGWDVPREEPSAHTAACGAEPAPTERSWAASFPHPKTWNPSPWVINSFNPSQPAEMAQPQNLTDAKHVSTRQLFCIQLCVIKRSTSKFQYKLFI